MANKNIKGITIKLDGETKGLQEALKDVDKTSRDLSSELKQVDKLLKFNPGNTDLIAQKQKILSDQVQNTSEKLKRLKDAQQEVQAAFQHGDLGEEQHRAFQREIIQTESKLQQFENQLRTVGSDTSLSKAEQELHGVMEALKDVDKTSQNLSAELKQVDKLLKFDPGNAELVAQKQKILSDQVQNTAEKLRQLKDAQQEVQAAFQRGDLGEEQYRAFRREILQTESELKKFENQLQTIGSGTSLDRVEQVRESLKNVDKASHDLSAELKQVDNLLKFDPGNADLIAQKQKILSDQVKNTTEKLRQLKDAQQEVQSAFKRGDLNEGQYRSFQREIIRTENELKQFENKLQTLGSDTSLDHTKQELRDVREEAKKAVSAIAGIGAGIAGKNLVDQALDTSSLNTKIKVSMEVPPESIKSVRKAVRAIEAYGIDAGEALEGVRRQFALNANASDKANTQIVKGAGMITSAYDGIDFIELIQEINEISKQLGITDDESLALVNSLLKVGFPPEQLDIISEYGGQLKRAGYSAEEIQAIMAAGVKSGTWNIDNLLDGLKEGRIRLAEFGQAVPKSMSELLAKTDISAKQLQEWGKAVAAGGKTGKEAMQSAAQAILKVDDATTRNALGVAVFGTMWEDQGDKITETLLGIDDNLQDMTDSQKEFKEDMATLNADPAVQLKQAINDLKEAFAPLLVVVAGVISKIAQWMSDNPQLSSTIVGVIGAVGLLGGALAGLGAMFSGIKTALSVMQVAFAAFTSPAGWFVLAIAAIAGAAYLIINNWGTISEFFTTLWGQVSSIFNTSITVINNLLSTTWSSISTVTQTVWSGISGFFLQFWQIIQSIFQTALNFVVNLLAGYWSSMGGGLTQFWNGIVGVFRNIWEIIKNIFGGALLVILQMLTGKWSEIGSTITQIWGNITNAFSGIWQGIKNIFFGYLSAIKGYMSQTWSNMQNATRAIWSAISNFFTNTLANIGQTIASKFASFYQSIVNSLHAILGSIRNVFGSIRNVLSGINLYDIGANMIQGLINGIKSKISAVTETMSNLANGLIDKIEGILDINSPSKVFEQIGEYTGQGLENGLISMGSRVRNASEQLAANMMIQPNTDFALDTPSGNGSTGRYSDGNTGGGDNFTINFNGSVRSEDDIVKIARELEKLINKRKRGKGGGL